MPKNVKSEEAAEAQGNEKPGGETVGTGATASMLAREYAQAQRRFDQALQEGRLLVYKALMDAYRDYTTRLQEAQRDLGGYAAEAYQSYLSAIAESSASGVAADRGTDAYLELSRLGTEFPTQSGFREAVENAYHELMAALADAQGQPDAATRSATAYRAYLERLNEAWKLAAEAQSQAEQARSTFLAAWNEELTRRRQELESAYQTYVSNLTDAYTRSDVERRAADAAKDYMAAVQDALKQAQSLYAEAATGLIDTQKSALDSLSVETNRPG